MSGTECPCGSNKSFQTCCEPFINGNSLPETAEQLMRSRYSAYTLGELGYIKKTCAPEALKDYDEEGVRTWSKQSKWLGLKIESTEKGGPEDKRGKVEFTAKYELNGKVLEHHEVSDFRKDDKGRWLFVDGDSHVHQEGQGHHHHHKQETVVREGPKIGRNDPCTCGSGKKYKKCCGGAA
jgi:SEC-C motif domain protein